MNRFFAFVCTVFLASCGVGFAQDQPSPVRNWTDHMGRKVEAAFFGVRDGQVELRTKEGKEFLVGMDKFSAADQTYVCDTLLERAIAVHADGNGPRALEQIESLLALDADYHAAYLWKGTISLKLDDLEAARTAYKHYATVKPGDASGPRGVAVTYEKEGIKDLAKFWYQKALDIEPNDEQVKAALTALDKSGALPNDPFVPPTPAVESTPTVVPPQQNAPAANQKSAPTAAVDERKGFWQQGIVGLLGGRTVWWGRLIAIVLFTFGAVVGGAQVGMLYKKMHTADIAVPASFIGGITGGAFSYVLYWGIPIGWGWLFAAVITVLTTITACGAAGADG